MKPDNVTTINAKKHAIALSDKEFAVLEIVYSLGSCSAEQVQACLGGTDLLSLMRLLHDLTARGLLRRPEIDDRLLYGVRADYAALRRRMIVME